MVGISRSPKPTHCCFQRYLKPGALARLRDSKISAARSLRPKSPPPPPPRLPESEHHSPPSVPSSDGVPCFFGKLYGPRSLTRKKLVAARSVLFAAGLAASDPVLEPTGGVADSNSNGSLISVLNSDVVVAAH
ncbi:unnamed protein product [Linum tenue]|uniref:Uncharacterized protein n=1 Tax=Linum tenue TaxID=586396 RepID=A0AAV0LTK4_9ROSI|nr:unnamed protein product [Linum tenue]